MATYPSLPIENDSSREPINLTAVNVTASGGIRARSFASAQPYRFIVKHLYITQAEAESVFTMWSAGITSSHTLTWKDGNTYTVYFDGPPNIDQVRGLLWKAESNLVGHAA